MPTYQDDELLIKFEEYLSQTGLSSSTIVNYLADLRAFVRWGRQKVTQDFSLLGCRQDHIRRYRHHLAQELDRAATTVNRHLMSLRKLFGFATDLGITGQDPTDGVALVQAKEHEVAKPLSKAEVDKLLDVAAEGPRAGLARRDVAILQLLLHTGLRVSEIIELRKDDLVFDNPGLHLQVCGPDSRICSRQLPLPHTARQALHEYLQVRPQTGTNHIFLNQEGRPISKRTVQRIISNCAKNAGLQGVSAQALRRTFAVQLLATTQDLSLVSKRLGHQNVSITEQYLSIHKES